MGVFRDNWSLHQHEARRAEGLLARSPMQLLMAARRRRLAVLAYHGVDDPAQFARQVDWLADNVTVVTLGQATDSIRYGTPLPPRAVLITFDDGERSILEVGAPLLQGRGMSAVAFVVPGLVDTDNPFWWREVDELTRRRGAGPAEAAELVRRLKTVPDAERRRRIALLRRPGDSPVRTAQLTGDELRKLELDGIVVGNHSLTHPCLDRCDDATLYAEVHRAHELLTEMLGHAPTTFAYPNGNVDQRVRRAVASAGYTTAFGFDHRLVSADTDPLSISRVRVDSSAGLDRLRILVSGLHPALHHLRGRP